MTTRMLVTGGNGYLGSRLVAELLGSGVEVRATVRSLDAEAGIREALRRDGVDDAGLEVVTASLTEDDGWAHAVSGMDGVHHVASPLIHANTSADELVVPARDGAVRVLRAARDAGIRRVVLTSSFAAVGYTPKPVRDYTEDDWTDPETPGLPPYPLSKAVAERAAWDFVEHEGGGLELVVLNPTWIAGPPLIPTSRSSMQLFLGLLNGSLTAVPKQRFGIADVRDVAALHATAMTVQEAAGKRYLVLADGPTLTFREVAEILRDRTGGLGRRVSTAELPGEDPTPLTIHNERAKRELGFRPRDVVDTIVETAQRLRDLGMVEV